MARLQFRTHLLTGGLVLFLGQSVCAFPVPVQSDSDSAADAALQTRIVHTVKAYETWRSGLKPNQQTTGALRSKTDSTHSDSGREPETARRELARLGDIDQIHSFVCQLYARDPKIQLNGVEALSEIGGYASIEALANVMLENPPYRRTPPGHYFSLRTYALGTLSKLLPELKVPPIASFVSPSEQQFRNWYDWIGEHRAQLAQLPPSEGGNLAEKDCARLEKQDFTLADISAVHITTFGPRSGSSESTESFTIANRDGKFFIGGRPADKVALAALVNAVLDPNEELPSLSDIGITSAWLRDNAQAALASLPHRIESYNNDVPNGAVFTEEDKQQFLRLFVDMDAMDPVFRGNFFAVDGPKDGVTVEISLRDGQTVRLWSEGSSLFLLPWAMQGKTYKEIYDLRLSQAIADLLPKDAPNVDQLSASGKYALRARLALSLAINITSECSKKECRSM